MKYGLFILVLFVVSEAFAQGAIGKLNVLSVSEPENRSFRQHGSILPLIRQQDTTVFNSPDRKQKKGYTRISAAPDFAGQYDTSLFYRTAAGLALETAWRDKWYSRTLITAGWSLREGINQTHSAFTPLHNREAFIYTDIRSRIAYTPNRFLHVATGIDNQFFGEGYRSLFQSDQVAPNPFAMMRVNIWRLEYGLLYQVFNENNDLTKSRLWEFTATHYLSYNVTKNWNIGFIETVFFQPKDGSFNRSFEVEYLNPLVFFRPQEYSLGSSDNVILGLQTTYSHRSHTVYGQLLLDEFVLKEIRGRSRWWANKYGVQLGVKGKIQRMNYRLEANIMRPYVYAHINNGQNGGSQSRPIAHPLGSNFAEVLAQAQFPVMKKLSCMAYGVFQLKGTDENGLSWGGDIYQSYNNRPMEYGHTIGQGITLRSLRFGAEFRYVFKSGKNMVYFDPQFVYQWGDLPDNTTPAIAFGWRTSLFQERRQF